MDNMVQSEKYIFFQKLKLFVSDLTSYVSSDNGQWSIKGFIDIYKNVYTISADTKIISKIMEIHLFPKILEFAKNNKYKLILVDHQNYYPDITFESEDGIRFAVDFKTTYRDKSNANFCNGFTLGSHGEYFIKRSSNKNIQFPYNTYSGHFCLGIIYDRNDIGIDETHTYKLSHLRSIASVIQNIQFFVAEKWKIASDKSGSGNTANIGSINYIPDIINGNGMFSKLGEEWFDEYWMNYKKINIKTDNGEHKVISNLKEFVAYKRGNTALIVPKMTIKKVK